MKLKSIIAENWKSDGGVAFGVVPKTIWRKLIPVDDDNLINVTSRCLLVDTGDRKVLFDCGHGRKQNDKYYQYKYFFGEETLESSLQKAGYSKNHITDVVFTHLHDDHVGGAVKLDAKGKPDLVFPNAMHYVSKTQYDYSLNPSIRDGAAYFQENIQTLIDSGKLTFVEAPCEFLPGLEFRFYDGHTPGQIVPIIKNEGEAFVFLADFIPSAYHIPIVYLASVDMQPAVALKEKQEFLMEALKNNYTLIFQHDYYNEACTLKRDDKRGIVIDKVLTI